MGKGEIDKLEFMGLEFASLYGEYLEFAETNQPPLCKGSGGRIVLVGTLDYIRFIRYMM